MSPDLYGQLLEEMRVVRGARSSHDTRTAPGPDVPRPRLAAGYAFAAGLDQLSRFRIQHQEAASAIYRQYQAVCPVPIELRSPRLDMLRAAALLLAEIERLDQGEQAQK
jgi:hypothetical protein